MVDTHDDEAREKTRELLEIPSQAPFERKLLVDDLLPRTKPFISQPQRNGALLGRLQSFLPQLEQANKSLEDENKQCGNVGFEIVSEEDDDDENGTAGPRVELDLACGLFELNDEAAVAAAEHAITRHTTADRNVLESHLESSDSDDSDDETDKKDNPLGTAEKKRKVHPGIEELN